MLKKGKFKLFSYIIEEHLLFYKSLNRTKKILAFSIIETKGYYPLISILNKFLNKRFLKSFSIQLNVNDREKKIIILNFDEKKKGSIIRFFNLIHQKLSNAHEDIHFLKKKILEKTFLSILMNDFDSNVSISRIHDSITIKNDIESNFYYFYELSLNLLDNRSTFIHNFLKLSKNFNQSGYLIFNLKKDFNDNLIVIPLFIAIRNTHDPLNTFENQINKFYEYSIIKKQKIEVNEIHLILWRFNIFNNYFLFEDVSELFKNENKYNFEDLTMFNSQFEYNLLKKNIKFKRLNKNLILIEHKALLFTAINMDYDLTLRILKKYCLNYFIFLLILNNEEYNLMLEIDEIQLLKNIKIMNPSQFSEIELEVFKNNNLLKNTQVDRNILSRIVRM
jgi:hypothetical protein